MRPHTRLSAARLGAVIGLLGLLGLLAAPAALPVTAGVSDKLILRAGTDQDLQVLNPFNAVVVADFEAFTLNYDLLANFGPDLEPVPGFAESWEQDGKTWTFHIRDGMKWSDGEPATAEDAAYTYQLIIDATEQELTLGFGYLEPYLTNAGVVSVSVPDPLTLKVETEFENTLITQAYVPILPKHIWSKHTLKEIANAPDVTAFLNEPPVVGTGPYQALEWQPGDFIRFTRNPNDWQEQQGAADEVILQHFADTDTMVQALKTGGIDYVRDVGADQFTALKSEPGIVAVEGVSNGYSELAFNTRATHPGYHGRSAALEDPEFRDALGYAIDQQRLVDASLAGYGTPGTTIIPPFHTRWHVEPDRPRRFDIDEAKRRLDAAGYALDSQGRRLDKQAKPLNLRLTWPDSQETGASDAQFIVEWFGQLGITVEAAVTEEGRLIDDLLPPEADGPANFDMFMWGWVGDPDPTSLLNFFRTDEIGGSSDSFYSNPRYDELFLEQRAESEETARKALLAEIQNLVYDEAPYHILYYDSDLHAYRTDKFAGWSLQPSEGGTPLFSYGSLGYTVLTDVNAPSPSPSTAAPSGSPGPSPSAAPTNPAPTSGSPLPLLLGGGALVAILAIGLLAMRRRGPKPEEEE
ncbi:MAG TPA: ABC transporter substrate-binding protein [Candidatus Limnocylindrales bacterium]|jgi:peptide/nickel transport system substrate-binding protein